MQCVSNNNTKCAKNVTLPLSPTVFHCSLLQGRRSFCKPWERKTFLAYRQVMHTVIPSLLGHRQTGDLLQRPWLNQGGYIPTGLDQRCKEGARTPQNAAAGGYEQFTRHCADGQSQATIKHLSTSVVRGVRVALQVSVVHTMSPNDKHCSLLCSTLHNLAVWPIAKLKKDGHCTHSVIKWRVRLTIVVTETKQ